jgi:hypothetical protein
LWLCAMMDQSGFIMAHGRRSRAYLRLLIGRAVEATLYSPTSIVAELNEICERLGYTPELRFDREFTNVDCSGAPGSRRSEDSDLRLAYDLRG